MDDVEAIQATTSVVLVKYATNDAIREVTSQMLCTLVKKASVPAPSTLSSGMAQPYHLERMQLCTLNTVCLGSDACTFSASHCLV